MDVELSQLICLASVFQIDFASVQNVIGEAELAQPAVMRELSRTLGLFGIVEDRLELEAVIILCQICDCSDKGLQVHGVMIPKKWNISALFF